MLSLLDSLLRNIWSADPDSKKTKFSKLKTLLKKRSGAETKIERVCAKISKSVKDVTFDKADATSLQERLALAFADFANFQDEVMTLDDVDMQGEATHCGRIEDMCDAGKKNLSNVTAEFGKKFFSASEKSVKLPKLNLPSFSGRYTEWMSFFDFYGLSRFKQNIVRCSKATVPKNICEGRTTSFGKFVEDHKYKL